MSELGIRRHARSQKQDEERQLTTLQLKLTDFKVNALIIISFGG